MRKLFAILVAVLLAATVWAQSPEKMSYQAVIRNSSNALVTNTQIGMEINIRQGTPTGTVVYTETQTPTTNANGLVSIEIGGGAGFNAINWANGPYFIETKTDIAGGTNYTITGTSQLLSVPYALHAKTAQSITGGITETDPLWSASPSSGITNSNITNWNSAFGWGNHATAGYLTNYTETDPVYTAKFDVTGAANGDLLRFNGTKFVKFTPNYLTSFTENDPLWTASPSFGITNSNITNWNTAFGWGNHSGLYRLITWVPAWTDVTGKPTFATVATSGSYNDLTNKPANATTTTDGFMSSADKIKLNSLATGTAAGQMLYWNGTAWVVVAATPNEGAALQMIGGIPTWVGGIPNVTNPATGKIWMDRNLGASQVATSSTDAASYGYLYQWGRGTDWHQIRTSGTTTTLSGSDSPGHANFILIPTSPYDWRSPQNNSLWQGVNGTNNPCPSGYRLPTAAEWDAERLSWSSNNSAGAFASPLKLPVAGYRSYSSGSLVVVGSYGVYWSSTVDGTNSRGMGFDSSSALVYSSGRAFGYSVRCIRD